MINNESSIQYNNIFELIHVIRGQKVILDFDLASLYQTETRALKQQVKRNMDRFPEDFMIELTKKEWKELITNCDKLSYHKFSPATPYAFTEQGVAMLSSVLKSKKAIEVNSYIMRAFVKLRSSIINYDKLSNQLNKLKNKTNRHDKQINLIIETINLMTLGEETESKEELGFKITE